jgi:elongation factor G
MNHYPAEMIRNVGVFGHGGSGKTSLTEAMLFDSKAITRLGKVEDGNTSSDFDPDETQRKISINAAVLPVLHNDHKINVLDAPGYSDFVGEMRSVARVVDGALIVVDASAGAEVGTELAWRIAREHNLPRVIFVNKMDRENANFKQTIDSLHETFGKNIAPIQFPIGSEKSFKGIVDLLSGHALVFHDNADGGYEEVPIPAECAEDVEAYRRTLVEVIAEHNEDLMMRYLDDEPIGDEELHHELQACIDDGTVVPLLCGAATSNRGILPLIEAIIEHVPPASLRTEVATDGTQLTADPDGPLVALAFKTVADAHVGRVTCFRVFSGSFQSSSHVRNTSRDTDERIGQVFYLIGKEHDATDTIGAGDIGGVSKLNSVVTGDTLADEHSTLVLNPIQFPEPVYLSAVHPKTKSDLDKLSAALSRLHEEDPSLIVSRSAETGETLIGGLGEPHIQIALDRMTRRSGVNIEHGLPRVAYRETIGHKTLAEYKHKKQTGGAGQYGHVFLELEPLPESEFEFTTRVVGGSVPKNFFPGVEKGVKEAVQAGPLAGYPVVNIRVTLTDGSYHDVDSNEMAFKIAAREAFKKGVLEAQPTILEPVLTLEITVPDSYTGDIISDLNGKRAHVSGMEPGEDGTTIIQANAPAAEVQRYATDLRSITQGRGSFKSTFSHYQTIPAHLIEKVCHDAVEVATADVL